MKLVRIEENQYQRVYLQKEYSSTRIILGWEQGNDENFLKDTINSRNFEIEFKNEFVMPSNLNAIGIYRRHYGTESIGFVLKFPISNTQVHVGDVYAFTSDLDDNGNDAIVVTFIGNRAAGTISKDGKRSAEVLLNSKQIRSINVNNEVLTFGKSWQLVTSIDSSFSAKLTHYSYKRVDGFHRMYSVDENSGLLEITFPNTGYHWYKDSQGVWQGGASGEPTYRIREILKDGSTDTYDRIEFQTISGDDYRQSLLSAFLLVFKETEEA